MGALDNVACPIVKHCRILNYFSENIRQEAVGIRQSPTASL